MTEFLHDGAIFTRKDYFLRALDDLLAVLIDEGCMEHARKVQEIMEIIQTLPSDLE